jgi:hypothetical protein
MSIDLDKITEERLRDYTVLGIVDVFKEHGWRIVKLESTGWHYENRPMWVVKDEL